MGDVSLKCPLCCNTNFSSKELLVEHLSTTIGNLFCPICNSKWPSVVQLIEHLSHESCLQAQSMQLNSTIPQLRTIVIEKSSQQESHELHSNDSNLLEFKNDTINTASTSLPEKSTEATEDDNSMYAELMLKPKYQTDLQFVKNSENQYVIFTQDHDDTVLTKQNNDGTISLRSVKEMKMETDSEISTTESKTEESQENLYSCNTCGVSFTSVIEHIQNYHNDQDVVVEEPMDEAENEIPIEYEPTKSDDEAPSNEKQTSRRVITDTGDIVETPLDKTTTEEQNATEQNDKLAGPGSKRYVRMNNLCESVVMNLKQNDKNGSSHKVQIKEVMTKDGNTIKYFHCLFCNVNVSSLSDFKTQPCKNSKYSCLQCPVSYDNAKSLCAHMKIHKVKTGDGTEKEIIETFECEICCTLFPTNKSLKLHKRMHDPVKSRQIEAPRNSDFSEMRYLCTVCEKMIPVDYRVIHEKSHLNEQSLLNCSICNKKFSSEEYLDMHMNVHNSEKAPLTKQDQSLPYNCVYCDRRFARPHEKVKHERIHTGEKPHSCEICGKSFRVSYCLTLHMRTHTGARPYGCPHCGKRFKAHSVYNHHLLTHSDVRAYKCPYCPKAFKTSVQLAGHKNSHTKPFSCTHCNRPFASLYAVRVHTETHARQNSLKFSCSLCGASYARAFALKDHIKQQHKDDVMKTESVTIEEWVGGENESTADVEIKSSLQALDKDIEISMDQLEMPPDELIVPN